MHLLLADTLIIDDGVILKIYRIQYVHTRRSFAHQGSCCCCCSSSCTFSCSSSQYMRWHLMWNSDTRYHFKNQHGLAWWPSGLCLHFSNKFVVWPSTERVSGSLTGLTVHSISTSPFSSHNQHYSSVECKVNTGSRQISVSISHSSLRL